MTLREQKILAAIKYFIKNTDNLGRVKLFKLLFYWDFRYFSKHGKSITGFEYVTYPFGPVPDDLFKMIDNNKLPKYLSDEIEFLNDNKLDADDGYKRFKMRLKKNDIDLSCFTKYEKDELDEVVEIFKECTGTDIMESSHLPNTPWTKTKEEKGMQQIIDYFLAIDKDTPLDRQEIEERYQLQRSLAHNGFN